MSDAVSSDERHPGRDETGRDRSGRDRSDLDRQDLDRPGCDRSGHARPDREAIDTDDVATRGLDVYVVGGAVRDQLLNLPAGDRDWVVVGATPEAMTARGFIPVGGDFPVFLHPRTKEEFALARTERKTARGYQGFSFYTGPEVTLADDLSRRDLTVNAIARAADGTLIDPLNARPDIDARVLRHVGEAFAEDPVRILRLARFAARFADFSVAPETLDLCRTMVNSGEVDALVPERVWKELSRGLLACAPSRMFDVLRDCGALARVAPDLTDDPELGKRLDRAAAVGLPLASRYAVLCLASEARDAVGKRWRVPSICSDYARLLPKVVDGAHAVQWADVLDLIEHVDGLRKPDRLLALIQAVHEVVSSSINLARWQRALDAVRSVDAGAVVKSCAGDPARIKLALRAARLAALEGLGAAD